VVICDNRLVKQQSTINNHQRFKNHRS